MLIEQPARWLRLFYPHALWRMNKNEHAVYITFDDGPIPEATPIILDILDEFDVLCSGRQRSKIPRTI